MKKRLFLIRHAKSSWDNRNLPDHDRTLSTRGTLDIDIMRQSHQPLLENTDLVFSSTAVRAANTARELFNSGTVDINYNRELYTFDYRQLHKTSLNLFESINNQVKQIAIVGHNPALTKLISVFTGDELVNIPTCGFAVLHFKVEYWKALQHSHGKLMYFSAPKFWKDWH